MDLNSGVLILKNANSSMHELFVTTIGLFLDLLSFLYPLNAC